MNQRHDSDRSQRMTERMTVHDAARQLGISEDAVRMRVKRGTLPAEREGNRLYVLLDKQPNGVGLDESNALTSELRSRIAYLEGVQAGQRAEVRHLRGGERRGRIQRGNQRGLHSVRRLGHQRPGGPRRRLLRRVNFGVAYSSIS